MGVQGTVIPEKVVTPDLANQFLTRQCDAPVANQIEQQLVFLGRQVNWLVVNGHNPAGKIDLQPGERHGLVLETARLWLEIPANQDIEPQHDFPGRKWFHHIIIDSQLKSVNFVVFFSPCRKHEHRNALDLENFPTS